MATRIFATRFAGLGLLLASPQLSAEPASMAALSGTPSPMHPGGRFEVFAALPGVAVLHVWQSASGPGWEPKSWQPYSPAPANLTRGMVAGRDRIGRVVVAWIANDGAIHFAEALHPDASLTVSNDAVVPPGRDPVNPSDPKIYKFIQLDLGKYRDGTIEILALNERGRIFRVRQTQFVDNNQLWIGRMGFAPNPVGGGLLQNFSVSTLNGGLAMAATGKDGRVYVKKQTTAKTWDPDPWENLGGNQVQDVRAQESRDHQLEVIALGKNTSLYLNYQNVGSVAFAGWQPLSPLPFNKDFGPFLAFDRTNGGRLFAVTHSRFSGDGAFFKIAQGPNNGAWPNSFIPYALVTVNGTGVINPDYPTFLSQKGFAVAKDVFGHVHYFASYGSYPHVKHYSDSDVTSNNKFLTEEDPVPNNIPDLP